MKTRPWIIEAKAHESDKSIFKRLFPKWKTFRRYKSKQAQLHAIKALRRNWNDLEFRRAYDNTKTA